jgi:hypothetical protein
MEEEKLLKKEWRQSPLKNKGSKVLLKVMEESPFHN